MKKLIVLIVILGLGLGGYYAWKNFQHSSPAAATPNRATTAKAELRNISFAVNAAGEIAPAEQVSVRPEINGLLEQLPVDVGDQVKKDDLLFKLDDKVLQQQRASNVTDIEKARLGVEKAERDYKRAQQLLTEKLISQELYDDTKTAFDLAKNALERAQPTFHPATLIVFRARMQGFLVTDYAARFNEAIPRLARWVLDGDIRYRETVTEGLENAPRAFIGMLNGENRGKALVKV